MECGNSCFQSSSSSDHAILSANQWNVNCLLFQVYCASNVQIVTLRRTEHLTEENLRDLHQQRRSEDGGNADHGPVDIVFPGGHSNLLTNLLQTAAAESGDKPNLDASHVSNTGSIRMSILIFRWPTDPCVVVCCVTRPFC